MSERLHLATPDPEWFEAAKNLPPRPAAWTDILALRAFSDPLNVHLNDQKKKDYPDTVLKIHEIKIPVKDGEIPARIYNPQYHTANGDVNLKEQGFPLLVWFHGGGHCIGTLEGDDWRLRNLAVEKRISVLNVLYRHAPEFPWPTDVEDCYASLKWALAHTSELQADLRNGFIVGGLSAGATLTAVVTHLARDDPEFTPKPTGQILEQPFVIHWNHVPVELKSNYLSMEQNKEAPVLNQNTMRLFYDAYASVEDDPRTSPLLFPSHASLPPAHFKICGFDPLRDDGFIYADALAKAGVKTKVDVYPGVPHGFQNVWSNIAQGKKWQEDSKTGLDWLLDGAKQ